MIDVIKEYLVQLGVNVDEAGYNKFKKSLKSMDKEVTSFTKQMTTSFGGASIAVVTSLISVNTAIAGILSGVAKADLEYQKLARTMWITTDSAKGMSKALDAMGESMDDVAWIPELNAQYRELIGLNNEMKAPAELGEQMKFVRSIGFEFTKMKLAATNALEWLAYYLVKYLGEPLRKIKVMLQDVSQSITVNMPKYTKAIAQGLSLAVGTTERLIRIVMGLWERVQKFWDNLPKGIKNAAIALGAAFAIVKSGPFGWFLTALGAGLLLLEDFFYYVDGKKSSQTLAPIWKALLNAMETLDNWLAIANDYIATFYDYLDDTGSIDTFSDSVNTLYKGIASLTKGIANVFSETQKWFNFVTKQDSFVRFWDNVKKVLKGVVDIASGVVRTLGEIGNIIGLLMQGKFAEASKATLGLATKNVKDLFSIGSDIGGGLFGMAGSTAKMWGDTFDYAQYGPMEYQPGAGKYSLKNGYELEGVQDQTLSMLDYVSQAYTKIFGKELMVTAGTNGSHAGGEFSHGSGWKIDITDDWSNDLMGENQELREVFIKYLKAAGIGVGDEYLDTDGANWTGGHLDLSAENFDPSKLYAMNYQPAASSQRPMQTAPTVIGGDAVINVYPTPGMDEAALARLTVQELKKSNIESAAYARGLTRGVALQG